LEKEKNFEFEWRSELQYDIFKLIIKPSDLIVGMGAFQKFAKLAKKE